MLSRKPHPMTLHQPNSLEARDVAYQLHPYTNARRHEEIGPIVIAKGDGVFVEDVDGKRYLEAMAGLWSVAVGFSEPRLGEAASRQMAKLPFYHSFTHKAHGPGIELAEKLIAMAPVPMSKVHFTSSGSEANDTIVKLLRYRANALGQPEKKGIVSRIKGYHGVTLASASLTGLPNNHNAFACNDDATDHAIKDVGIVHIVARDNLDQDSGLLVIGCLCRGGVEPCFR